MDDDVLGPLAPHDPFAPFGWVEAYFPHMFLGALALIAVGFVIVVALSLANSRRASREDALRLEERSLAEALPVDVEENARLMVQRGDITRAAACIHAGTRLTQDEAAAHVNRIRKELRGSSDKPMLTSR